MARAKRTVRVFCDQKEQAELSREFKVLESYDAFTLLEVTAREGVGLASARPLEDITGSFGLVVNGRRVRTDLPRIDALGRTRPHPAYKAIRRLPRGRHHYLVQFVGPIRKAWIAQVKRAGGEPRIPYKDFTWIVRCDRAALARVAALPCVRWLGHWCHRDRVQLRTRSQGLPRTRGLANVCRVEFLSGRDLAKSLGALRRSGASLLSHDLKAGIATLRLATGAAAERRCVESLSAVHGVRSIRPHAFNRTSNDVATELMATAKATAPAIDLSGDGEVVAVCDTGFDLGSKSAVHPDFDGRVKAIRSYPITADLTSLIANPGGDDGAADFDSGHGTHAAGSAVGSGAASTEIPGQARSIRGLAHRAKLVVQAVEQEVEWKDPADLQRYGRFLLAGIPDDLSSVFSYAYRQGARIHSNSWSGGEPGEYDGQCWQLDEFVWKHRDFCVLVAAGNDGTDADGDGVINAMSVTSPSTAKNCITVGASESLRREFDGVRYGDWWPDDYPAPPFQSAPMANGPSQVVAFSSRGPTGQGRVKPDVVAPGTYILSTRSRALSPGTHGWSAFPSSPDYFYLGGTSMATPLVSGAVACLREFFKVWVGLSSPSAALIKASLIGGATKLRGTSPASEVRDNEQGHGLVNLDAIVAPGDDTEVFFHDDDSGLDTGQADEFALQVRSTEVPLRVALAYSDFPGEHLVNNLNLMLVAPSGRTWIGNGSSGSTLTLDDVNNTEVVHIRRPQQGEWTLRVVASNVPEGPQPYAFMLSGDATM